MDQKTQMLGYIVNAAASNKSETNPLGFCYLPAGSENVATELHNDELIQALMTSRAADNSYPVRPTELGVKWLAASGVQTVAQPQPAPSVMQAQQPAQGYVQAHQQQPQPQPSPAQQHMAAIGAVKLEKDVPIPDRKAFGRGSPGDTMLDRYPFATMVVNQSFFVPQDVPPRLDKDGAEVLKHRSFSSVVSQANRKFHPKNFMVREWREDNGQVGARVWRVEDMQGERPTRTRKPRTSAAPQPQHPGQSAAQFAPDVGPAMLPGGFPAPGNPGFGGGFPAPGPGMQGGFPGPGGFPQPGYPQAPQQPVQADPGSAWGQAPVGTDLPPFGS